MREISVFIPAYNSQEMIEQAVRATYDVLRPNFDCFEVVVVNDNSSDGTRQRVESLMTELDGLRLVNYPVGPSRRENLADAMKTARFNVVLFQDADLAVDVQNIIRMHTAIDNGTCDVAIGSRYMGIAPQRSLYRLTLSQVFNLFLRACFGSNVNDHICGFKAFSRMALLDVLQEVGYDASYERGWFWDALVLVVAKRKGYRIMELAVEWRAGQESSFRLRREIRMIPSIYRALRSGRSPGNAAYPKTGNVESKDFIKRSTFE